MVPFVQQSSCSFCHNIEVLPGELQCDGEVPPILFPSPYLSQHFSIPYSKKPPPKQISGHSSHTKNIIITFNGVPLDTFNASFVQLSEKCKKFCSHSRLFSRKLTQFSHYCMRMCVFLITESWNFTVWPRIQRNRKILSKDECLGCRKIKICEHKITGPVVWEDTNCGQYIKINPDIEGHKKKRKCRAPHILC
jgi:hypothetical protein